MATQLFVITGPPGSGKTPILRELIDRGFAGVPEPAREVLAEQRAIDGDGIYDRNPSLFHELMLSRAVADFQRMRTATSPVFFDRGVPDLVGYAELFGLDVATAKQAADIHRYNDIVFALPSWPEIYTTDDERRMTFAAAQTFGERVRQTYEDLDYTLIDVPRGTVPARASFIVDTLKQHGGAESASRHFR